MAHDKLSISFSTHNTASKVMFDNLLGNEEFADVTLVCDDERVIKAHKVILCAFSPFFKNILLKISSPHPVIYLSGISYKDLLSILQFIYKGETQIEDIELDSFLESGKKLKVLGIYPEETFEQKALQNLSQVYPGVFTEDTAKSIGGRNESPSPENDIGDMLNVEIKVEPADEMEQDKTENVATFKQMEDISVKEEFIDELIEKNHHIQAEHEENIEPINKSMSKPAKVEQHPATTQQGIKSDIRRSKLLKCQHCHFKTVKSLLLKKHVQKIHSGSFSAQGNITCNYCDKKFWSVNTLNVHKTDVHNVVRA